MILSFDHMVTARKIYCGWDFYVWENSMVCCALIIHQLEYLYV